MKKVVINNCSDFDSYFSLSNKALIEYFKRKKIDIYFYIWNYNFYDLIDPDEIDINCLNLTSEYTLSFNYQGVNPVNLDHTFEYEYIKRNDPILVEIVEEMGGDADGNMSCLEVVEVKSKWKIAYDEDGREYIAYKK